MKNLSPRGAYVVDIEADNLLEDVTKIHCLSYSPVHELNVTTLTDYEDIKRFVADELKTVIWHNGICYDAPTIEKILGVRVTARQVDTLGISYYIHSSDGRVKHGLESYGEDFGVPKPKIDDWENQTLEDYVHRCQEDVKINWRLWKEQQEYLKELYENDNSEVLRLIDYIAFKYDCLKEQNENRIPVDVDLVATEIVRLSELVEEKRSSLLKVMPEVVKYRTITKPKKMYKADGELSSIGNKWLTHLQENGFDSSFEGDSIEIVDYKEEGNPDSISQIKDWLYSLGWEPKHFKFDRNKKTGEVRQIPQITSEHDKTEICESIVELAEQVPEVQELAGYSTVKHRLTIFKAFVRDMDKDFRLVGDAMGWTNTFRLKHRVLVNLPKHTAPYAENIRACLIAEEDGYMVGRDLKGIEDATKQHYIYPFDPEYVKEMQSGDYDAHTSVAVAAGLMTVEEEVLFKKIDGVEDKSVFSEEEIKEYKRLKLVRQDSKVVNFSAIYSVGVKTLARNMKKSEKEAKKVLDAYWVKNKSVRQFVATLEVKTVRGQMWLKQPVSKFWYSLRYDKDKFSTANQSTAVYVFDMWVKHQRSLGLKISFQSHDESLGLHKFTESKESVKENILEAMRLTNEELQLNVQIGCSIDFGYNYRDCH